MTLRKNALIASTAIALAATPLLANTDYKFDASNTLAGEVYSVDVMGDKVGDQIVTREGELLGTLEDFKITEDGRAHMQVDLEADLLFEGDTMDLTIDPANVTILDGAVALNASEEELFAARGAVGGAVQVDYK
ncbi:hypothetical protein [uncultured Tateyamaria sp.]|uniref:hypothetical protein n=1 Tax=uncultured Tateyamaria sp. TaxID=455651 RepID=UPI00262FFCB6|nr:hypothetical protein [uncultured Tateyamaria sp.]